MLKFRAISFPALLGILALVVFWPTGGPLIFFALAILISALATLEMASLAEKAGVASFRWILLAAVLSAVIPFHNPLLDRIFSCIAVLCIFGCFLGILFDPDHKHGVMAAFGSFGLGAFLIYVLWSLIHIYIFFSPLDFLMLVLITKAADTGGYVFGMLSARLMPNGNHKIVPRISPKKSWEGTVGAVLFSIGVAAIFAKCGVITLPWYGVVLLGFFGFLGSFAGDLTESVIKRAAGVKDSGSWIPGMGGVWDVLDSFIYNAPIFLLAKMLELF